MKVLVMLGAVASMLAHCVLPILAASACLPPYVPSYSAVGCYTDSDTRTLITTAYTSSANNTPEACATVCGQDGYSYAGVEYGRECYCGDAILPPGAPANDSSDCNMACYGNSSLICGGTWYINIYEISNPSSTSGPPGLPNCFRPPLCSNPICDTTLGIEERAAGLVAEFNLSQKASNMMNGSPGLPSIGLPAYQWWSEALHGVASSPGVSFSALNGSEFSYATSFPAPILMGASFDDDLIHQVATIIGVEGRSFANNFKSGFDFWTPNINPFRDPRWGRGLEVPGEDPFHIQQYVYNLITGLQGGLDPEVPTVIATCKHFAVYDVETGRNSDDLNPTAQDLSEYYLAGFKTCTRDAKVGAVMCSYNAEYGIPSCANRYLLQNVLREYWNWSAPYNWITSDCAAVSDIVDNHKYVTSDAAAVAVATNAGTDLGCENSIETNLVDAVAQGLTTEAAIDQALMRLYASLIKVGYFGGAPDNLTSLGWSNVNTPQAQQLAYLAAAEGMTLLKNNGILPLPHSISNVAVIGPWANATTQMQGNYEGTAPFLISPLISFQSAWSNVMFAQGTEINTEDTSGFAAALQTASSADYIIYCGGIDTTIEAEGLDRQTITWPGNQLNLISQLAALDKPLVVVQFGGGQVDDSAILNNTGVGALVWAGYPGQAGGNALHDVLVGSYAIAGRLPISQYPADYINTVNMWDPGMRPDPETGNPGRTYRWYPDAVFPMGYGLHYTNFSFSCSCPVPKSISIASLFQNAKGEYLGTSSWTSLTVSIENTGKLTSDYVALLFLSSGNAGPAPYPIKTLVSYARAKAIAPGSSSKVKLSMTLASLARADAEGNFYIYPGDYTLALDVDSVLTVNFTLTGNATLLEAVPLIPTNPVAMSYLGCFSNPASALSGGPSMSIDLNAPQACSDECGAAGYSYAGVQGSTCLCASSFSGAPNTTDAACGAACPGDIYEFCGGPGAVNVYNITPAVFPEAPTFAG